MPSTALAPISSIQYPCWGFVDYENCRSLKNIPFHLYTNIYFFVSDVCTSIDFKYLPRQSANQFHVVYIDGDTENNMDFHIVLYIGMLHQSTPKDIEFHIISADRGYDGIKKQINKLGRRCSRYGLINLDKYSVNTARSSRKKSKKCSSDLAQIRSIQNTQATEFLNWLETGLKNKTLTINQRDSHIHMTADGLFLLYRGIFQAYQVTRYSKLKKAFIITFGRTAYECAYLDREAQLAIGRVKGVLITNPDMLIKDFNWPNPSFFFSNKSIVSAKKNPAWYRGTLFIEWLDWYLRQNKPSRLAYMTRDGLLLVSPSIFKMYDNLNWETAQKSFIRLKYHVRNKNGNFCKYRINGNPKKKPISGLLISDIDTLFPGINLPINPKLVKAD